MDDDRLLDDPDIKLAILAAWNESHVEKPLLDRAEVGFWIWKTTDIRARTSFETTSFRSDGDPREVTLERPGYTVVAAFHTHPLGGERENPWAPSATGGLWSHEPSARDIAEARRMRIPIYVLSSAGLFRFDPERDSEPVLLMDAAYLSFDPFAISLQSIRKAYLTTGEMAARGIVVPFCGY